MKPNLNEVGDRIRNIIDSRGLTLEQFGEKIGDTPISSVNNWLRGVSLPNKKRLAAIAKIGNTSIDWIKWGTLEEYIAQYLSCNDHGELLTDFPEIPNTIFKKIQEQYTYSFSISDDYELLNPIINTIFKQLYSQIYSEYLNSIIDFDLKDSIISFSENNHNISPDTFRKRFINNFYSTVKSNRFVYGKKELIIETALEILQDMDSAYRVKISYESIEDFFNQNTKNHEQTEKFLSDLSTKYGFPYTKNSPTSQFLTKNNKHFN